MKFPNLNDPKLAEFVGIMLGDGSIGIYKCNAPNRITTMHQMKISIDSRETDYINYLVQMFDYLFGFKPRINYKKKENTADIRTFRREIVKFVLNEVGLKISPKWNTAKIPYRYFRNNLEIEVLRGIFDTDGSITITKNNGLLYPRLELKICPSPMQTQFIEIVDRIGCDFKVQRLEKGKIRIRINGKSELLKWLKIVGTSNPKHLNRANKILGIAEAGFEPTTCPQQSPALFSGAPEQPMGHS